MFDDARLLRRRLLLFGLIGLTGTLVHYVLMLGLVELAAWHPVNATTLGFLAGALVNYYLNYHFTFESTKHHLDAGPKFFFVAFLTGLFNGALVYLGVTIFQLNYIFVQLGATLVVFVVNFGLNSLWSFREKKCARI